MERTSFSSVVVVEWNITKLMGKKIYKKKDKKET
jgi:hypothetical protein